MSARRAVPSAVRQRQQWLGRLFVIAGLVLMLWAVGSVSHGLGPFLAARGLVPWAKKAAGTTGLAPWGLLGLGAACVIGAAARSRQVRAFAAAIGVSMAAILLFIQWAYPHHLLWQPIRLARAVFGQDLALRDYAPRSMLRVASHDVPKARYPVINIHTHFVSGIHRSPDEMIRIMNATNVERVIDLDGGLGDHVRAAIEKYATPYPDRLIIFATFPFSNKMKWKLFGDRVKQLEEAKRLGVRGIKIWKFLGLKTRDDDGTLLAVDDQRLDELWETAGRLHLPILIHLGDPEAFFEPVDAHNERYEELTYLQPDWSFADPQYPRPAQLLAQFEHVLVRHRDTQFIGAHLMNIVEDLQTLGAMLDRNPNLFVDIAARANELGRQPITARAFLIKYANRVLFGTDGNPDEFLYRGYFRFLETADEYFDYPKRPGYNAGRWEIYGLQLPDDVLRKIYHDNAARLLGVALLVDTPS